VGKQLSDNAVSYKIGLEVFPRLETVIEEMKLARCGEHPGGANPAEILDPYLTCVNSIRVYIVRGSLHSPGLYIVQDST
jgi:hypothetical protein